MGQKLTAFHEITAETIYLMGGSFILGSLFTLLMLILLEFIRSTSGKEKNPDAEQ